MTRVPGGFAVNPPTARPTCAAVGEMIDPDIVKVLAPTVRFSVCTKPVDGGAIAVAELRQPVNTKITEPTSAAVITYGVLAATS